MSFLLFRIMNHVIRTLARPGINWITHYKKIYLKDKNNKKGAVLYLVKGFQFLGQKTFQFNNKINKTFFNLKSLDENKLLSEEKALEKGIETFSEILIYALLIYIPINEYRKMSFIANKEKQYKKDKFMQLNDEIIRLSNVNEANKAEIISIGNDIDFKIKSIMSNKI